MAYQILFLKDIAELKSRRGNSITPLLGVILGVDYPLTEAVATYEWQDASTVTTDDFQHVGSLLGDPNVGRWERVDLSQIPQVNADWNATSGPAQIYNKPVPLQGPPGIQGIQGIQGVPGVDARRIDVYTGTTDANGLFTVTYPTAFPVVPYLQPEPVASNNQTWVKVSSTTTGFSLRLVQRNSVTLLATEILLAATVNVASAAAKVVVVAG